MKRTTLATLEADVREAILDDMTCTWTAAILGMPDRLLESEDALDRAERLVEWNDADDDTVPGVMYSRDWNRDNGFNPHDGSILL